MYPRIFCLLLALSTVSQQAWSAPSVADALKLKPVQGEVPFDTPSKAELKECTIRAEKRGSVTAWVIRGPKGDPLRSFPDSNGDNIVDTWSYFRDGLEIYRDIDTDFNGKVDQSRWFHGAGSRWGIDRDEDGTIDSWRTISAEETAEEVVAAVRTRNTARFRRLLLSGGDLKKLGLAEAQTKQLAARIQAASKQFETLASGKRIEKGGEFTDFGGLKPGVVPAGTQGSKKDLLVYENVWAMVRNDQDHVQLQLGTMIQVGGAWKLVDGPSLGDSQKRTTGFFFNSEGAGESAIAMTNSTPPSEKMQEILTALEKLDQQLARAKESQYPALNSKRAELLAQLAKSASTAAEREQWVMQLADMISAAVQSGGFPGGAKRLEQLEGDLDALDVSPDVKSHVQFRRLQAEFGAQLSDSDADYAKVQAEWLEQLEIYVEANASRSERQKQPSFRSTAAIGDVQRVCWQEQGSGKVVSPHRKRFPQERQRRQSAWGSPAVYLPRTDDFSARHRGPWWKGRFEAIPWQGRGDSILERLQPNLQSRPRDSEGAVCQAWRTRAGNLGRKSRLHSGRTARLPPRKPPALETALRNRRLRKSAGQRNGHHHLTADVAGRSARQSRQPRHSSRRAGIGNQETAGSKKIATKLHPVCKYCNVCGLCRTRMVRL